MYIITNSKQKSLPYYTMPYLANLKTLSMLHTEQIKILYIILGNRIKEERERLNFKQTNFANLLQISRASLVNIEKGRQRAPLHVLYEMARLLDVAVSELLPDSTQILGSEVNKNIRLKIEKKSGGNEELHKKLVEFVKSHTTSRKILHS